MNGKEYQGTSRGKFKQQEIKPVVGDNVIVQEIDKDNVFITQVLERKSFLKRPKVSNVSQVVFVISPKMPSPNLCLIDKELCFAEFLNLKSVIVINKANLDEEKSNELFNLYKTAGYNVIKTNAQTGEGIDELKRILKNNENVLAGQSGVRKIDYHQ